MGALLAATGPLAFGQPAIAEANRPKEVAPDAVPYSDVSIFLDLDVEAWEVATLRRMVESSSRIRTFAFLDEEAARQDYRRLARTNPDLPPLRPSDPLPISFQLILRNKQADKTVTHRFEGRPGVDEVASRTTEQRKDRALECKPPLDLEVFLRIGATADEQSATRTLLESHPAITGVRFVSQEEALNVFHCIFIAEPSYRRSVTAESVPASLWLTAAPDADLAALQQEFAALPGVEDVAITQRTMDGKDRNAAA